MNTTSNTTDRTFSFTIDDTLWESVREKEEKNSEFRRFKPEQKRSVVMAKCESIAIQEFFNLGNPNAEYHVVYNLKRYRKPTPNEIYTARNCALIAHCMASPDFTVYAV